MSELMKAARPDDECGRLRSWRPQVPPARIFVLSGPSGVGKDTVISRLKALDPRLHVVVTVTTRPMRPHEVQGGTYYFVSLDEFHQLQSRGALLEWATVHGNQYGTPLDQVRQALSAGNDVLLNIDVQGAARVRERVADAVLIFLAPPSLDELTRRLRSRRTESPKEQACRLREACHEMDHLPAYDYVVVNQRDKVDETVEQIKSIVTAEKSSLRARQVVL